MLMSCPSFTRRRSRRRNWSCSAAGFRCGPGTGEAGAPALVKAGGFRLDDPDGVVGIELMVVTDTAGGEPVAYHVPLTYRGTPLDGADGALIGTTEHGVLGTRWVYDGTRDPVFAEQLVALIQGTAQPQAQSQSDMPDLTVRRRAASPARLEPGRFSAADGPDGTLPLSTQAMPGSCAYACCASWRPSPIPRFGRGFWAWLRHGPVAVARLDDEPKRLRNGGVRLSPNDTRRPRRDGRQERHASMRSAGP